MKKIILPITIVTFVAAWVLIPHNKNVPSYSSQGANWLVSNQEQPTNTEEPTVAVQTTDTDVDNTNTKPSPNKSVASLNNPTIDPSIPPQEEITPPPVTVSGFQEVVIDENNIDCLITYTDESSHQWHWKKIEYNQEVKMTNTAGKCDSSIIGYAKYDNFVGYTY